MIDSLAMIGVARGFLAYSPPNEPNQEELRRAVSTAYYALFHRILREGADRLVGDTERLRGSKPWLLIYRAFNHGSMAERCGQIVRPPAPLHAGDFPPAVQAIATAFKSLQSDRHRADYDPEAMFELEFAEGRVEAAHDAIEQMDDLASSDSALFVTFLLFGARRAGG